MRSVRFNPNLYAGGKVCLSILGTWSGESEDEWRSSYSLSYVLSAIQSLIMNGSPYHNEPGYDKVEGGRAKKDEVEHYSKKIKHEVCCGDCMCRRPDSTYSYVLCCVVLCFSALLHALRCYEWPYAKQSIER